MLCTAGGKLQNNWSCRILKERSIYIRKGINNKRTQTNVQIDLSRRPGHYKHIPPGEQLHFTAHNIDKD